MPPQEPLAHLGSPDGIIPQQTEQTEESVLGIIPGTAVEVAVALGVDVGPIMTQIVAGIGLGALQNLVNVTSTTAEAIVTSAMNEAIDHLVAAAVDPLVGRETGTGTAVMVGIETGTGFGIDRDLDLVIAPVIEIMAGVVIEVGIVMIIVIVDDIHVPPLVDGHALAIGVEISVPARDLLLLLGGVRVLDPLLDEDHVLVAALDPDVPTRAHLTSTATCLALVTAVHHPDAESDPPSEIREHDSVTLTAISRALSAPHKKESQKRPQTLPRNCPRNQLEIRKNAGLVTVAGAADGAAADDEALVAGAVAAGAGVGADKKKRPGLAGDRKDKFPSLHTQPACINTYV